jgi:hypothetical protein
MVLDYDNDITTTMAEIRILCLQLKPGGFPRIKLIDMDVKYKRENKWGNKEN